MIQAKKKILVIDDEPDTVSFLKTRLEASGYRVDTASGGYQAIGKYYQALARDPFDLVLLDIMMPDLDGKEVLETFRRIEDKLSAFQEKHRVPVIMLTADYKSYLDSFNRGCDDFILKPYDAESLLGTIASKFR